MEKKGQGALEYLLLIGGAVLIAVIVIAVITSLTNTTGNTVTNTGNCALKTCDQCKALPGSCSGYKADGTTMAWAAGTYCDATDAAAFARCGTSSSTAPPCGGALINGYCWYAGTLGDNCNTVCASHGGCNSALNWNDDTSCTVCHALFTGALAGCSTNVSGRAPVYYPLPSTNRCYRRFNTVALDCALSSATAQRICACAN